MINRWLSGDVYMNARIFVGIPSIRSQMRVCGSWILHICFSGWWRAAIVRWTRIIWPGCLDRPWWDMGCLNLLQQPSWGTQTLSQRFSFYSAVRRPDDFMPMNTLTSVLHYVCCSCLRLCVACCPSLKPTGKVSLPPTRNRSRPPLLQPAARMVDAVGFIFSRSALVLCPSVSLFVLSVWASVKWQLPEQVETEVVTGFVSFQVDSSSRWRLQSWTTITRPPAEGLWEAGSGTWAIRDPACKATTDQQLLCTPVSCTDLREIKKNNWEPVWDSARFQFETTGIQIWDWSVAAKQSLFRSPKGWWVIQPGPSISR